MSDQKLSVLTAATSVAETDRIYGVVGGQSRSISTSWLHSHNPVINGNFDIWQRGTSFVGVGINVYTADRWITNGAGAISTVSRQSFALGQTEVPGEPTFFLRFDVTTAAAFAGLRQRIEDVRTFAGQTITVSLWAKADAAATYDLKIIQEFGSGGSAQVVVTHLTRLSLTTAWQKFIRTFSVPSISGKTIGTGIVSLGVIINNFVSELRTLDLAQIKIERGAVATPFVKRPIAEELALCQRYFTKTFPQLVTPADNTGRAGALGFDSRTITGTASPHINWQFPVTMRGIPTVTLYSPQGGTAGEWRNVGNSASSANASASAADTHDRGAFISNFGVGLAADLWQIHAAADAEL